MSSVTCRSAWLPTETKREKPSRRLFATCTSSRPRFPLCETSATPPCSKSPNARLRRRPGQLAQGCVGALAEDLAAAAIDQVHVAPVVVAQRIDREPVAPLTWGRGCAEDRHRLRVEQGPQVPRGRRAGLDERSPRTHAEGSEFVGIISGPSTPAAAFRRR